MCVSVIELIGNFYDDATSLPTVGGVTIGLGGVLVLTSRRISSYSDPRFLAAPPREKGRLIYATCIITAYCVILQQFVYSEANLSKTIVEVRL